MKSIDFRCYTSETGATAETINVAAGSQLGVWANQQVYHPGVVNVYMAKAPGNVSEWDGSGEVWFKVYEISAKTDGGKTISWPSSSMPLSAVLPYPLTSNFKDLSGVSFTIPKSLPSGE